MSSEIVLPQDVLDVITKVVELTSLPSDTIRGEYMEILTEVQKTFPEFSEIAAQHKYAAGILWARYRARGPTREVSIIPVGYDGFRVRKNGEKYSKLYVVTAKGEKKIVFLSGTEAELYKSVTLGARYTVRLMEFKSGNFGADNRTVFKNPQPLNTDLLSLFRRLKVYEFKDLATAASGKMVSSVTRTSTGEFVDSLDWRIVKGIITRLNTGTRKDGVSQFGVINLSDTSLGQEETVASDGTVIPTTFSVWCDPTLMNWGIESEVYAVGTVSMPRQSGGQQDDALTTKYASMNAICIIPSTFASPVRK